MNWIQSTVFRKAIAVSSAVILCLILTWIGIYKFNQYGLALFVLIPIILGFTSTVILGFKNQTTKKQSFQISFISLYFYVLGLLLLRIEGLICIAMAAPFGILISILGSFIGFKIINKNSKKAPITLLFLVILFPLFSFYDKKTEPKLYSVLTKIEIEADIETVWANVVSFPPLEEPNEYIFKVGISYPINATIDGDEVGAIRKCNFNTGSFVEPISIWDKPHLLSFNVIEQPKPMKELSFWKIDAPHLHDFFVSKKGQFKLTETSKSTTILEGTTWYYHNIKPALYWKIWSDMIVHKIHLRVLNHIKKNSETTQKSQ